MVLGLYKSETEAPPAGISGVYHEKDKKILHVHYGNDVLESHMHHVIEHHEIFPNNDRLYHVVQKNSIANRIKNMAKTTLARIRGTARDEKPPNMVVHDGNSVTMKRVPAKESSKHFPE